MTAAAVRAVGRSPVIEERPDPESGPGQVPVREEASGPCRTGIPASHGDRPVEPTPGGPVGPFFGRGPDRDNRPRPPHAGS
ncbi:hypothetical protein [Streptomyces sp. NBC_01451]|uniref:hypothetical protein n=1 Tax=Streptomyces sp. NBC_01451 TaxID=2903872 RepID=UPI003FCDE42C